MIPYDPRPAMLSRDYTKTLLYVVLDLTFRILTAVALVVVGAAGWTLQRDAQARRQQTEEHDRLSRRYLPVYRTFTDLELVLQDCSEELAAAEAAERQDVLRDLSFQVKTAAISSFAAGDDLLARVDLPAVTHDADDVNTQPFRSATVPLRANAFMLPDLMQLSARVEEADLHRNPNTAIQIRTLLNRPTAAVLILLRAKLKQGGEQTVAYPAIGVQVRAETLTAWQAWNGEELIPASRVDRALVSIAQALHQQAVDALQQLMRAHPELGDQFVTIRSAAVAEQTTRRNARVQAKEARKGHSGNT